VKTMDEDYKNCEVYQIHESGGICWGPECEIRGSCPAYKRYFILTEEGENNKTIYAATCKCVDIPPVA